MAFYNLTTLTKSVPSELESKSDRTGQLFNQELRNLMRLGINRDVGPTFAYKLYNFNSAVSDAVDRIVQKAMNLRPIIKNSDGSVEKEHDVLEFLRRPNKLQNFKDFIETVATNYLLNKNTYMEVLGNINSAPIDIYGLKNTWVSITEKTNAALYQISVTGLYTFLGGTFNLTLETGRILSDNNLKEIMHAKGFTFSFGVLKAVSILSSIEREAGMIDQANNHNLSLLEKGFNGRGILSVNTQDNEGFEQLVGDLKNTQSGSGNANNLLAVKGEDIKFTAFGQTNKDMEYTKSRETARQTVFQRFEIPKPIMEGSSQTYSNYLTAQTALYDDAVFPLSDKIFASLTDLFVSRKMLQKDQFITFDTSEVPALQLRRNEELKALRQAFIMSLNELRSIAGKEEVPGGDIVYIPSNLVPAATDAFTDDNVDPPKQFMELMKQNGSPAEEIKELWHAYQTAFRSNEKG